MNMRDIPSIIYRQAQIKDAQRIVEINLNVWRTTYNDLIRSETIEARFLTYDKRVERTIEQIITDNTYIVAEIENQVVGFIQYIHSKNSNFADYGEIQALYILDDYHGIGIGKSLFNLALIELRRMGYHQIIINCLKGNAANEFYLKMGTHIDSIKEENMMNEILIENIHVMNI